MGHGRGAGSARLLDPDSTTSRCTAAWTADDERLQLVGNAGPRFAASPPRPCCHTPGTPLKRSQEAHVCPVDARTARARARERERGRRTLLALALVGALPLPSALVPWVWLPVTSAAAASFALACASTAKGAGGWARRCGRAGAWAVAGATTARASGTAGWRTQTGEKERGASWAAWDRVRREARERRGR